MELFDLHGRVALVTGGNGGIGLAIARGLAAAGAKVVIAGRNPAKNAAALADLIAGGADAHALLADVADEAACRAMVTDAAAHYGRLDILVNNAGYGGLKRPEATSVAEWNAMFATNLTGAFVAAQAAYPHLQAAGGGKIINIGSLMSFLGGANSVPYCATKGGLLQLTRSLAVAWAGDNIQVNAVLPGWTETEIATRIRTEAPKTYENVKRRTPARRWGTPADMAGVCIFLAAPASDFVTGAGIPVDGGYGVQG
jgi:2-deoxy-D-gluconate 3-dehydrogenase